MHRLLFIAKVTFICNLFFVVCLLLRHTRITIPPPFIEFVIITGWIMSVILNVLFAIVVIILKINKQVLTVPVWLKVFNVSAFIFQIGYFLISFV